MKILLPLLLHCLSDALRILLLGLRVLSDVNFVWKNCICKYYSNSRAPSLSLFWALFLNSFLSFDFRVAFTHSWWWWGGGGGGGGGGLWSYVQTEVIRSSAVLKCLCT